MDRLINYGGWTKSSFYPTSNSEYGRGILTSMKKAGGNDGTMTFDPSAPNSYYPQTVTSTGGAPWQQPMGHSHHPNCPHFGVGANTKYPTGATTANYGQFPGMSSGSNMVQTADHIEVLHGDAAQAYLAQQNQADDDDQSQPRQAMTFQSGQGQPMPQGMTVSFQPTQIDDGVGGGDDGGTDSAPAAVPPPHRGNNGGNVKTQRQSGAGDYVKVSGLPMGQRWGQGSPSQHSVSRARSTASNYRLCGKCSKCKNLDPGSIRPQSYAPSTTRFPVPRGIKPQRKVGVTSSPLGSQQQSMAKNLPIQGDTFVQNLATGTLSQQ